ncbi:MAG: hypothetical protein DME26_15595 [Verrucomicrobia bacterium]|nr:MAG: hypothetical protein DME26_15595 [Verrucomicrobiota bacterium]
MRHFAGGLDQHQAVIDGYAIETPARKIGDQRIVIVFGIVPTQGELEAVFAFGRTVTRARGAAGFAQNWLDVANEADFRGRPIFNSHRQFGCHIGRGYRDFRVTLVLRFQEAFRGDLDVGGICFEDRLRRQIDKLATFGFSENQNPPFIAAIEQLERIGF